MANTSDTGKCNLYDYDLIPVGHVGDVFTIKAPAGLSVDLQTDTDAISAGVHPVIGINVRLGRAGIGHFYYLLPGKERKAVEVAPHAGVLTPNHGFDLVDEGLVYGVEWMETSTGYKLLPKYVFLSEAVIAGTTVAAPVVKAPAVAPAKKSSPSAKAAAKKAAAAPPATPGPGKKASPSARAAAMKAKATAAKVEEVEPVDHPAKSMPKKAPAKAPVTKAVPKAAEVTAPPRKARPGAARAKA